MAVNKRGFRRIVVDGIAYRWKFPLRLTQRQEDGWPGVAVAVQRVEPAGAFLWVAFPQRHHPSGACGHLSQPILPSEVAAGIRAALVAGWMSDLPGKQFVQRVEEPDATSRSS